MESYIRVKQIKSQIAVPKKLKKVIRNGLGLSAIGKERMYKDNNCIRGMVNKVKHLVEYELVKK